MAKGEVMKVRVETDELEAFDKAVAKYAKRAKRSGVTRSTIIREQMAKFARTEENYKPRSQRKKA